MHYVSQNRTGQIQGHPNTKAECHASYASIEQAYEANTDSVLTPACAIISICLSVREFTVFTMPSALGNARPISSNDSLLSTSSKSVLVVVGTAILKCLHLQCKHNMAA